MTEHSLKTEWKSFADTISGNTGGTKAAFFNHDNAFQIHNDEVTIDISWGEQPQRGRGSHVTRQTMFRFRLDNQNICKLKIYPRDTLSNLISLFSAGRQKTEDPEIDKTYIFISDSKTAVHNIAGILKPFLQETNFKDFIVETETISGECLLRIQVNDLLTRQKDLSLFYELGLQLRKQLA